MLASASARPFHMDDAIYLEWARSIALHPLDPYAGEINWHGTSEPLVSAIRNPPLWGWALALLGSISGWSERALHLAQLVPSAVFLWASHALARRWCARPWVALALVAFAPVFLLTSATVMADTALAAAWTCAILCWCRPPGERGTALGVLALAVAGLLKWYGLALVPLLYCWELLSAGRPTRRSAWLLMPLALALALELWTRAQHGASLFASAEQHSIGAEGLALDAGLRAWIGCAFLGGACGGALLVLPLLARPHGRLVALAAAAGALAAFLVRGELRRWPSLAQATQGESWAIAIQAGVWGFLGLALILLALAELRVRTREARLLALWIGGTCVFAIFVDWAILARSVLPALPAFAIVLARALEGARVMQRAAGRTLLGLALGAGALLGVVLLRADTEVAEEARASATELARAPSGTRVWFQGHWGFQWYAQAAGARAQDRARPAPSAGDRILVPMLNSNIFGVDAQRVRVLEERKRALHSPLVVLGPRSGAGWWAHTLGPLPFAWNLGEVAQTWVFERR
ncbi:MAG: glycosyltransferase family 39 protein [Planctomycetes bacterium]|nr:glycosyltransferase family 39 protein [Planctomycetota bacterium]